MGRRGPVPKPVALKIIEGNPGKRRVRAKATAPGSAVSCPGWLTGDARAEWRRLAPALSKASRLQTSSFVGHTVRVLARPYYPGGPHSDFLEASFTAVGCEMAYRSPEEWAKDAGTIPDLNSIPERLMMVRTMSLWTPMSVPWAIETSREIKSFQPDVMVADLTARGAGIAGEAAGTPRVVLLTTIPVHRQLPGLPIPGRAAPPDADDSAQREEFLNLSRDVSLPYLNAARTAVGLNLDDDPWAWEDRANRVIVLSSRSFDYPAEAYPANMVYVGSVRPQANAGAWDFPWDTADERPLVVVSGTTTGLSGLWFAVFQASANALLELGMRGIFTVGTLSPQTFPQSEALAYRSFAARSVVLPKAAAMVTQCGHGATMSALRHGLPMVCVPVFADQYDIAGRVEYHGAGIRLSTLSSPNEFRDAIAAVTSEPKYCDAARALAKRLAPEDGASEAANQIEDVAASDEQASRGSDFPKEISH